MSKIIYFSRIWPMQHLSAASVRVLSIIDMLQKLDYEVHFVSSQKLTNERKEMIEAVLPNKTYRQIDPNNFKAITKYLNGFETPFLSIFDTFVTEEYYGHFMYSMHPETPRILDTQDLHSLRVARLKKFEEIQKSSPGDFWSAEHMNTVLKEFPSALEDDYHARELASIYRSDITWISSEYEKMMLERLYGLERLLVMPIFYEGNQIDASKYLFQREYTPKIEGDFSEPRAFQRRSNFVWLGNFAHSPNLQAVDYLISEIWPKISKKLESKKNLKKTPELHIYGANFPKEMKDKIRGIPRVKARGLMPSLERLMRYRALLAPLFYGAGIKGKITSSWVNLLPVITTPVGSEGLYSSSYENLAELQDVDLDAKYYKLSEEDQLKRQFEPFDQSLIDFYDYPTHLTDKAKSDGLGLDEELKEVLGSKLEFGGSFLNYSADDFVDSAVEVYSEYETWHRMVDVGLETLDNRFLLDKSQIVMSNNILDVGMNLKEYRRRNHVQQLVWSETLRSMEYLNKLIRIKNLKHQSD